MSEPTFCQCGCGEVAPVSPRDYPSRGIKKGDQLRVVRGHGLNGLWQMERNPRWRGGKRVTGDGYVSVRVASGREEMEHRIIAERALGHALPTGAVVHHVDKDRADNRNKNLVICQDDAYHNLLHQRTRALIACGHAGWWRCAYCKKYDDPVNDMSERGGVSVKRYHRICHNTYQRERRKAEKARRGIKIGGTL